MKIFGQVQGVFFRQGVKDMADELGLTGWVRNEEDDSVKIVVEGEEENLRKLIDWCKTGTSEFMVDHVDIVWHDAADEFDKFQVVP